MRDRENALMEIMHARVHNLGWSPYSICRSLSGCWASCEAVIPQGAARGVNLWRRFAPSHGAGSSLNMDLSQPFRLSENPTSIAHGIVIEHFLSQRSAPHSNTASFGSRQSLKGSDRYSLRHRRRTCTATSTLRSLKGSDKYDIIYSHNL